MGWKKVSVNRRKKTREEYEALRSQSSSFCSDFIPIKIEHLSFSYLDGVPVMQDVTLSVQQGQMIAVIGPPGSGKTTLLHLIANTMPNESVFLPEYLRVLFV